MGVSGFTIWQLLIVFVVILIPLFFLPTIIAVMKNHPHKLPIILINIFGGLFLGIGWFVALIWSFILPDARTAVTYNSTAVELERLHALKEKGALSQAEYDAQKRIILNS